MTSKPAIHLHIDELVLDGFPESARHQIAAGLTSELQMLLEKDGLPSGWSKSAEKIDGGSIRLTSPGANGKQIARAIYGGAEK